MSMSLLSGRGASVPGEARQASWWAGHLEGLGGTREEPPSAHLGLNWAFLLPAQESYKYFPSSVSPASQGGAGHAGRLFRASPEILPCSSRQ